MFSFIVCKHLGKKLQFFFHLGPYIGWKSNHIRQLKDNSYSKDFETQTFEIIFCYKNHLHPTFCFINDDCFFHNIHVNNRSPQFIWLCVNCVCIIFCVLIDLCIIMMIFYFKWFQVYCFLFVHLSLSRVQHFIRSSSTHCFVLTFINQIHSSTSIFVFQMFPLLFHTPPFLPFFTKVSLSQSLLNCIWYDYPEK